MKIKNALLGLIFIIGFGASAQAKDRIRDELITTTDRTCGIHYLTRGNTVGWYLTEVEGLCPNGLLNGSGHVVLRNAFGRVVQNIDGFFAQGYPTESDYEGIALKSLLLSDSKNQSLIFDLGQEERLDIRYLGKMTAAQQSDGAYSAFDACHPAIILAVTPDLSFFEDEAVQQELVNSVLSRVATVCPTTPRIYFYGSQKESPENADIAFFADIDLESGHIKVRRLPSSPRIRDILTNPSEAADIPIPKEIRHETGLPIVQITPVKPDVKPASAPILQEAQKLPINSPIPPTPIMEARLEPVVQMTEPNPLIPLETAPKAEPEPIEAVNNPASTLDDIPALLTASRLLKQPVEGRALLHIAHFDAMGVALTDGPVVLRVKGNNLPLGWIVVNGTFSHTPPKAANDTIGFVQVQSFAPLKEK